MMASPKPTMILLSKTDLSESDISQISDNDAWVLIYSIRERKAVDNRIQVCFTGFGLTEKKQLMSLAEEKNFNVVKSVTKKLDFLIGGDNSGPKKVEKAESQGVQFLTLEQFENLINTGELPTKPD